MRRAASLFADSHDITSRVGREEEEKVPRGRRISTFGFSGHEGEIGFQIGGALFSS